MPKRQAEIVNDIRRVFTIGFLDPFAVRVILSGGRATISGEINRLPGNDSPITARALTILELDLMSIRELRHIRWQVSNWSNEAGQWRPVTRNQAGK